MPRHDHGDDHDDHSGHDHGSLASRVTPRRLAGVATLNVVLALAQLVGGLAFASVALLADTAHQAIDAAGLVISAVAVYLLRRPPSHRRTFGWGRADALGALVSGLILAASVVWLVYEAIERLIEPADVDGWGVLVIGAIGALINGLSARFVGHGDELSVRAARIHLLTDMAGSLAVVVSGLVVALTDWARIDPLISLGISVVVALATIRLLAHAANVLLDAAPRGLHTAEIREAMQAVPGVSDVHHLHVWSLSPGDVAVTAHIAVDGASSVHDAQGQVRALEGVLAERFGINHLTVQVECHPCATPEHAAEG